MLPKGPSGASEGGTKVRRMSVAGVASFVTRAHLSRDKCDMDCLRLSNRSQAFSPSSYPNTSG